MSNNSIKNKLTMNKILTYIITVLFIPMFFSVVFLDGSISLKKYIENRITTFRFNHAESHEIEKYYFESDEDTGINIISSQKEIPIIEYHCLKYNGIDLIIPDKYYCEKFDNKEKIFFKLYYDEYGLSVSVTITDQKYKNNDSITSYYETCLKKHSYYYHILSTDLGKQYCIFTQDIDYENIYYELTFVKDNVWCVMKFIYPSEYQEDLELILHENLKYQLLQM